MDEILFISDVHFSYPFKEEDKIKENNLICLLNSYQNKIKSLFLVGDIFDFWFEYKYFILKGPIRFLGKLAELSDRGIKIFYLGGNHDLWIFDYLTKEVGLIFFSDFFTFEEKNKKFYVSHGDFITPNFSFKIVRKIFKSKIAQKTFAFFHPFIGFKLAKAWSSYGKSKEKNYLEKKLKNDLNYILNYAEHNLFSIYDYVILGHRHYPYEKTLLNNKKLIIIGDWIKNFTYAHFDGNDLHLKKFI